MLENIKYNNVDWAEGTPIAGERLSTNGHLTGEHKGTPMQAKDEADANSNPHYLEENIIRHGTLMQDAADENFPREYLPEPV